MQTLFRRRTDPHLDVKTSAIAARWSSKKPIIQTHLEDPNPELSSFAGEISFTGSVKIISTPEISKKRKPSHKDRLSRFSNLFDEEINIELRDIAIKTILFLTVIKCINLLTDINIISNHINKFLVSYPLPFLLISSLFSNISFCIGLITQPKEKE
ncbi:MAG: hypothetical protein AABX38_06700 [Candidatus Micrarchaeota archaeon]